MYLLDKDYNVYVDMTIPGRHDPNTPKRTYIRYVVDGIEQLKGVKEITAEETNIAECEVILFAIRELKGSIEAKYTTNKGVLPDSLVNEMREAFKRSEEFLDLEVKQEDPLLKQKEQLHNAIANATPEKVQEMLNMLGICNT